MRVAIGGISHESSTFSTVPTTLQHFYERGYHEDAELMTAFSGTKSALGGFIDAAKVADYEVVPTLMASAVPAGPVTAEATETLTTRLADRLRQLMESGPLDGVLLSLHGAMVSELDDDGESYIVRKVREVVGPNLPVIVELDLHGNITQELVDLASMCVAYDEYPHTDPYERGYEAGIHMAEIVRGGKKPTPVIVKVPLLTAIQRQHTHADPMLTFKRIAREVEHERGIMNVSYLPGFPYADIEPTNFSIIVTADNDEAHARDAANRLARYIWSIKDEFEPRPKPVDQAVIDAMNSPANPIVLADISDNPGGGGPADGTVLLKALLRLGATNTAMVPMVDPESVKAAQAAGEGNEVQLRLGGKTDDMHGEPLEVSGRVIRLTNGNFVHKGPMNTGVQVNLGDTAVVELDGQNNGKVLVIVTSLRYQPTDLEVFRSQGIEPTAAQILVVKSSVHFRAAFTPIAAEIVEVDTPGLTNPDLAKLNYKKLKRPIYPFDADMVWEPE
jgi:microcystin degradation protein MlrC